MADLFLDNQHDRRGGDDEDRGEEDIGDQEENKLKLSNRDKFLVIVVIAAFVAAFIFIFIYGLDFI